MMDDTRVLTILIVDDSATDRAIIRGMLGEYNTLTAADGRQAMDILDGKPGVDLMILDLNMPVMDGFQVLEAMRGNDRYKDVRTIILTDYQPSTRRSGDWSWAPLILSGSPFTWNRSARGSGCTQYCWQSSMPCSSSLVRK